MIESSERKLYAGKLRKQSDERDVALTATPRRGALLCKQLVMAWALFGALSAYADDDTLRYPEKTKARLLAKEIIPYGGLNYFYDLDGKTDTAELIFHYPRECHETSKRPRVGSYKTIEALRQEAEQEYSISPRDLKGYNINGKEMSISSPKDMLEGLYKTSEPISINMRELRNRCIDERTPRYPNDLKVRYVAREKVKGKEGREVKFYFDVDGNLNTAEVILHFPLVRRSFENLPIDSFISIGKIRYEATAGYAAITSRSLPSYFEFKPGVRVLTSYKNDYIKGLYKETDPVSVDVSQLRKAHRENPFRYERDQYLTFIGQERRKDGTRVHYFNLDVDLHTAEVVLLVKNPCKDCASKLDNARLYSGTTVYELAAAAKRMSLKHEKIYGVKNSAEVLGVYKNQRKISINVSHLDNIRELYNRKR